MGSYAENEEDAREYAELKRQLAEQYLEDQRLLAKKKPVVTMNEIIEHRFEQRELENAGRHMEAQNEWSAYLDRFPLDARIDGENYERSEGQEEILDEIRLIVKNNIVYGTPPYSLESAEGILLDIINDLTSLKERLSFIGI
jgi:hypothetical protein